MDAKIGSRKIYSLIKPDERSVGGGIGEETMICHVRRRYWL
jgi:hypothetical protein